jgi:hypothetical protein
MGEVVGSIVPHWYDVANSLRDLADEIEEGLYGDITSLALVMEPESAPLETWCCGPQSGARSSMLLHGEAFLMYVSSEGAA